MATVITSTMQALPITTPSVVRNARSLFDQSASTATRTVSLRSINAPGNASTSNITQPRASHYFTADLAAVALVARHSRARATPEVVPPLQVIRASWLAAVNTGEPRPGPASRAFFY